MKLLSCYVEGFGNLKKREYTFDGLTVLTRENGAGKTTLASFIKDRKSTRLNSSHIH